MDEQTQSSDVVTQGTVTATVEGTLNPSTEDGDRAPEPTLEPSLLQKTEDAVIGAVHKVEDAVEHGIDSLKEALHLGQHGHAAAQAEDPLHPNPFASTAETQGE